MIIQIQYKICYVLYLLHSRTRTKIYEINYCRIAQCTHTVYLVEAITVNHSIWTFHTLPLTLYTKNSFFCLNSYIFLSFFLSLFRLFPEPYICLAFFLSLFLL